MGRAQQQRWGHSRRQISGASISSGRSPTGPSSSYPLSLHPEGTALNECCAALALCLLP